MSNCNSLVQPIQSCECDYVRPPITSSFLRLDKNDNLEMVINAVLIDGELVGGTVYPHGSFEIVNGTNGKPVKIIFSY
jgi:hypothetical protein